MPVFSTLRTNAAALRSKAATSEAAPLRIARSVIPYRKLRNQEFRDPGELVVKQQREALKTATKGFAVFDVSQGNFEWMHGSSEAVLEKIGADATLGMAAGVVMMAHAGTAVADAYHLNSYAKAKWLVESQGVEPLIERDPGEITKNRMKTAVYGGLTAAGAVAFAYVEHLMPGASNALSHVIEHATFGEDSFFSAKGILDLGIFGGTLAAAGKTGFSHADVRGGINRAKVLSEVEAGQIVPGSRSAEALAEKAAEEANPDRKAHLDIELT